MSTLLRALGSLIGPDDILLLPSSSSSSSITITTRTTTAVAMMISIRSVADMAVAAIASDKYWPVVFGICGVMVLFGVTDLEDSLFRFVIDSTRKAIDDMFFLVCTNLGDSLTYINNNNNNNNNEKASTFTLNLRRRCRWRRIISRRIVDYGRWHELPVELMEMILQRTDVTDHFRMSMVCKSWELVLKRKDVRLPPQFPWLLLPRESLYCKKLTFYDMSHGRIHDIKLPNGISGGRWRCLGSSKGWLIMAVKEEFLLPKAQIFIFNPISGARHKLPSLRTLPCFRDNPLYRIFDPFYHIFDPCTVEHFFGGRIELSSEDPTNCVVAAIVHDTESKLVFCRVGGESWGIYEDSNEDKFSDILFSKDEKILYVLKYTDKESVATYSFTSTDYQLTLKIIPLSYSNPTVFSPDENDDDGYFEHLDEDLLITRGLFTSHLVESTNGQLLLIKTTVDAFVTIIANEEDADAREEVAGASEDDAIEDNNEEDGAIIYDDNIDEGINEDDNEVHEQVEENNTGILKYYRSRKFDIYKLDPETGTSCVTKVRSLGSQILFISLSGISFVQGRDFTGFQENCIYFIESYFNNRQRSPLVNRESGIFYLDDERIERCFPSTKLPVRGHMGWFTPNPFNQSV